MKRCGSVAWLCCALLLGSLAARADFPDGFNHAGVDWLEYQTPHFVVVFNKGLGTTARLTGEILEEIHKPVCDALGTVPEERTTVVLADFDDVGANNFARRLQHVIYLSNPIMNQARVERRAWLSSLLTHEYTHVVNGWALERAGHFLGKLTEWSGMEFQPQWFTEGLAEYVAHDRRKDDVSYALYAAQQNELLQNAKLDIAEARFDVIETATVYKQGHAMCIYLAQRFGEDVFHKIITKYGTVPQWDIAFQLATGTSVQAFTREFITHLREQAGRLPKAEALDATSRLVPTGHLTAALGARPSPDGKWNAVYGVADWEEPIAGLWLYSVDGAKRIKVGGELDLYASWKFSWSPDSSKLIYVARVRDGSGSVRNGLFVYDLKTGRTAKVPTGKLRVGEPEYSPDGTRIAFGTYRDERALLATMAADGSDVKVLDAIPVDAFSPTWSPNGAMLAFSVTDAKGTDLALVNADGTGYRRVTNDPQPDQYPAWSPDGRTLAYVSYRAGAEETGSGRSAAVAGEAEGLSGSGTNVYTIPVDGGVPTPLTAATTGGVFYPAWTKDGSQLLVSLFKVRRAEIRSLPVGTRAGQAPPALGPVPARAASETQGASPDPPAVRPNLGPLAKQEGPQPVLAVAVPTRTAATKPVLGAASETAQAAAPRLGPASVQPAAAPLLGPAGALAPPSTPVRPYRSFSRIDYYLTRPYNTDDGLGTAWGVRSQFADPLLMHRFTAEMQYGVKSHRIGYQVQYRNDQTDLQTGINIFRRVPPFRGERNALVAETSEGVELLAALPVSWFGNAFAKDKLSFGWEAADHQPFATAGGILRPAPVGAWIVGPTVQFDRVELLPGTGQHQIRVKLADSLRWAGADIGFFRGTATYVGKFWAPDPRHTFNLIGLLDGYDGQDFTRAQSSQLIGLLEARYDWRICDDVAGNATWPYFYVGPVTLSAGWQARDVLAGVPGGVDVRDRATLEVQNNGYLTRNFAYQLAAGNRTFVGGNNQSEWYLQFKVHFRDLPF